MSFSRDTTVSRGRTFVRLNWVWRETPCGTSCSCGGKIMGRSSLSNPYPRGKSHAGCSVVLFQSPTILVTTGRDSRNVETHNQQQVGEGLRERGQKPYGKIAWRPLDVQYRAIQIPNPRFYTQNREQTGGEHLFIHFWGSN